MPTLLMLPHTSSFSSLIAHNSDVNQCFEEDNLWRQPLNIGPCGLFSLSVVPAGWDGWIIVECLCSETPGLFISFFIEVVVMKVQIQVWTKRPEKKRANLVEQVYVLYLWIWPVSVPVCLKWLYLSVCMFYSFTSTFVLTCTVAVLLSAIWEISLNCYHYYCISIVLLKIWHVVH